jgi:hypothetical protein
MTLLDVANGVAGVFIILSVAYAVPKVRRNNQQATMREKLRHELVLYRAGVSDVHRAQPEDVRTITQEHEARLWKELEREAMRG